jgi:uncharacterized damage-inducible protein DinB
MKVGQTITQDDINLKLFEELEKLSEKIDNSEKRAEERLEKFENRMDERQEKFEKNIREDMKQFTTNMDRQGKWQLAIFTVLTASILYKLFSIPTPITP